MSLDLSIDIQKEGPVTIISLRGELDDFHAPKLNDAFAQVIDDEACRKLIVNLDEVSFVDSVGLGTIAIAGKKILKEDGLLNLVCTKALISKLITASGIVDAMGKRIGLYDTLEDAKNNLN
jgi:anti-anti-sigma factor